MKKNQKKENLKNTEVQIQEFPNIYFLGLFLLTTVIFFFGQLFGNSFFWEDFVEYVYPVQTYAAVAAGQGSIPFWNPYAFSGMPFIADLQVGFFYPFNRLLFLFIDSDGHLSVWGLQFIIILHFFIAQITFYYLMRYKKVSSLAAAIGAIGYTFSMMMICHVIHPMIVYHLAWFPLIFMFFIRALDEHDYRYGIASGLILGITMLSGHPQTTLYLAFFLGIYLLWYISDNFRAPDKKILLLSVVSAVIVFIVALGVFQIQFLTSSELADLSLRAEMTVEKSAEGSLEFQQITNFVNPHQFGKISGDDVNQANFNMKLANGEPAPYFYYWETAFYFGVVVFLLGLIGIVACKKNKFIQFLLIMTVLGLLHALGSNFFIHGIFYELPFFGQFRNPARMMVYVVFAFSIFASFGFDKLFKSTYNEMKISIIISASLVALLILIAFSSVSTGDVPMNTALMSLLYFAISIAIIFMISTRKIGFTLSGLLLILILFMDLYLAGGDFNASKEDPQLTYKMEQNMLKSFKPNPPDDIFRVNTRSYSPPYMATKRNQGMIDRFMNTEGYNPLVLQRVNPSLNETDEIYDLLNVKYILKFDTSTNQPYFEENHDRLPNAWLVNRAHIFPADQVGEKMKKGSFDFSKEVILEEPLKIKLNSDEEIKSKVVCKEYKTNYLRYEILNPESNVVLVLSEIWYPSWKVFVDGLPAKLHRANYSLRAVEIPKGASKIELRFASESFAIGQWITLVTLLISLPLLVINLNKRKKNA